MFTQQNITYKRTNFSRFSVATNKVLLSYCGAWSERTSAYQFEYWISNIWVAFHPDQFIRFVADHQNTKLNFVFDLADMFIKETKMQ